MTKAERVRLEGFERRLDRIIERPEAILAHRAERESASPKAKGGEQDA